ncbi:type II secretion system F family protein [Erwinia rhapontici]|uniref:type II secretion system F family protein n=1 Tax=Erwinia rhapontici TaxID=55212 RepID=UPI00133173DC|nr:type II secretion system F family protein [Erwinia rhapontici]MBP2157390.1 type II secretory pathway component PulF [Erwinia rhapontici]
MNAAERLLYKATFNADDRVEIYDDFGQYLLDGRSVEDTYQKLIENNNRRGKSPGNPVAKILEECADNLKSGLSLGASLSEWIPDQELSIIESCALSGRPAQGFKNAIVIAEGTSRIRRSVKSTILIFAYLSGMSVGMVVLFCLMLVPVILQTVPLSQWNAMQTGVYWFYLTLTQYWYAAVLALSGGVAGIIWSLPRLTGPLRYFLDRFPPWSIYRRIHGAAFILNVNAMLSAGIPMEEAVASMKDSTRSDWLYERLDALEKALANGELNLGQALDATGYEFPDEKAIIKLQSLFETSNSEHSLKRFADKWLEKTVSDVEKTGDRLRNVCLLASGGAISTLILIMSGLLQKAFFMDS